MIVFMGNAKVVRLRCRVTMSHNHTVDFVNKKQKMLDNFVFLIRFTSFFRSDATMNNLPSLKKLGVEHVQRERYRCFNFEWTWSKILNL